MADTETLVYRIEVDSSDAAKKISDIQGAIEGISFSHLKEAGKFIRTITSEIDKTTGKLLKTRDVLFRVSEDGKRQFASFKKVFGEGPWTSWSSKIGRQNQSTSQIAEIRRAFNRVNASNLAEAARQESRSRTPIALLPSPSQAIASQIQHQWRLAKGGAIGTEWDAARKRHILDGFSSTGNEVLRSRARLRLIEKLGYDWETRGVESIAPLLVSSEEWASAQDAHRLSGYAAKPNVLAMRERARERLRQNLGYDWETKGISNANGYGALPLTQIERDGLANRIRMQALARARLRARLGEDWETAGVSNVNPRNPNSPYSRVSRLDKWSDSAYEHIKSLVPKGAARDIIGHIQGLGTIGKVIGLFCAGVLAATAALGVLKKVVSMLFDPFKKLAQEAFRFYRTRHMNSVSSGELTRAGIAGMIAGGNPDEMYALLTRITSQRAALRWGMGGGAFMEVARRFGVDISGSGPGGLATNTEWLRNIAIRMSELEPEDRIALANTAGLSREQMWLVSNGVKYFDWAMSKRTDAQQKWGWLTGSGVYSDNFQTESQNFHTDWAEFVTTMTEFFGSVGEIILPILNMILEVLTMIFSAINLVLKPLAFVVGKIFSLLNLSYWENKSTMDDAAPKYNSSDYGGMVDVHGTTPGTVNVNSVSINVQSNSADPTEVSEKVSEAFANNLAETWYRHNGHGLERGVA